MTDNADGCVNCGHTPHEGYYCTHPKGDSVCGCDRRHMPAPAITLKEGVDFDIDETPVTEAQALLASRRAVYGDRVSNMERTAQLWSALLGHTIHDWQVPLMMSAYKMLRTFEKPDYSDNSDDIDGWKEMFVEVMDANHGGIIKARTVEEYAPLKAEKDQREKLEGLIQDLQA